MDGCVGEVGAGLHLKKEEIYARFGSILHTTCQSQKRQICYHWLALGFSCTAILHVDADQLQPGYLTLCLLSTGRQPDWLYAACAYVQSTYSLGVNHGKYPEKNAARPHSMSWNILDKICIWSERLKLADNFRHQFTSPPPRSLLYHSEEVITVMELSLIEPDSCHHHVSHPSHSRVELYRRQLRNESTLPEPLIHPTNSNPTKPVGNSSHTFLPLVQSLVTCMQR